MNQIKLGVISVFAFVILGCAARDNFLNQNYSVNSEVRYRLTFDATWSEKTHPVAFPAQNNPHFSQIIGATHRKGTTLWQVGQPSSAGMISMAETGRTQLLSEEINKLIRSGQAEVTIVGDATGRSPDTVEVIFSLSPEFPAVSVVTMVAPSPDWFVGVSDISLFKEGEWVSEKTINLLVYDAGSDSGPTYTSGNQSTFPRGVITKLTSQPHHTSFSDGKNGTEYAGTFTFTKLED
tara:strand:- start:1533 stop:2240 length:708 start_codon:yes stop_codon:yes gene_type:complete